MSNKFLILPILCILLLTPSISFAALENDSFSLEEIDNLESKNISKDKQTIEKVSTDTTSQIIRGDDFMITVSFSGQHNLKPFTFSSSADSLNFGEIKAGEPLIRTQELNIKPGGNYSYQLSSYQDHPLRENKDEIPNTSCDNGNCTDVLSDVWVLPLTYGFGYRCDAVIGHGCSTREKDTYKRFASAELNESPALVLFSALASESKILISTKLNIAGNQVEKGYRNTVYYIATPTL